MDLAESILNNETFIASILSWFVAQCLKVVHTLIIDKRFNVSRFVGSGGMPSSHSAFVMGLTTAIGLTHGFDSSTFSMSLVFSLVIMYDAAGVRHAVGKQAAIINKIIEDIHNRKEKKITEKRLKELIGHTPIEVLAGAILGIIIANLVI
ncbi:MAG: divergent PAP2 family protein [Clostridiales bacterium]|nr:divergent PAP2 family protein [Clostridiales bacterium]